jgi:hypothetical protein
MANSHNKNNLVKTCGSSDTSSKHINDGQNNADSFNSSDLCSPKRSVVQDTNTKMDVRAKYTNLKQSNPTATFNTTASYRYKKCNKNIPNILHYNQIITIFHQNVRSLRYKTNELLCCIQDDPPHILCFTEHHLQYSELVLLHFENYTLGAHYCRNTKHMGCVGMYIQENIPFTCLEIGNYCKDQDIEICGTQLNYEYDKLCMLAVYTR